MVLSGGDERGVLHDVFRRAEGHTAQVRQPAGVAGPHAVRRDLERAGTSHHHAGAHGSAELLLPVVLSLPGGQLVLLRPARAAAVPQADGRPVYDLWSRVPRVLVRARGRAAPRAAE